MNVKELSFVNQRYLGEVKLYYNAMKCISIVMMTLTTIYLILRTIFFNPKFNEDLPFYSYWIIGIIALLLLVMIGLSYYFTIYKYFKDAKEGKKIIESCCILEKSTVNEACTLVLNSIYFKQIQVSKLDYDAYGAGDEINIEYALYSKYYFGYF
jgi:hypothetical protein